MNIHDTDDKTLSDAVKRYLKVAAVVNKNRELIQKQQGFLAESPERLDAFMDRKIEFYKDRLSKGGALARSCQAIANQNDGTLERKVGPINNILSIEFLEAGLLAARSVGFLTNNVECGTGFHVGNGILLTNNHVVKNKNQASEWRFILNMEANQYGDPKPQYTYYLDPEKFFLTNEELDFTLVAISGSLGDPAPDTFGWHVLLDVKGKVLIGQPVNIIQHADGDNKSVVVHDSCLLYLNDDNIDMEKYCLYSSDTERGSSGSPVFNNYWEVVALHHKAIPETDGSGGYVLKDGQPNYVANEGIRASRLVQAIKAATFARQEHELVRDSLIALWSEPGAHQRGLKGV